MCASPNQHPTAPLTPLQVRRWDAESGKLLAEAQVHDDAIQDMQLSPDGSYVITASLDKTAQVG